MYEMFYNPYLLLWRLAEQSALKALLKFSNKTHKAISAAVTVTYRTSLVWQLLTT